MKPENYFLKNGEIYGISTKYDRSRWSGYAVRFTDLDDAYDWLYTEEYDFRERELVSKTVAKGWGYKEDEK